mgnify:CR=1 FL=1
MFRIIALTSLVGATYPKLIYSHSLVNQNVGVVCQNSLAGKQKTQPPNSNDGKLSFYALIPDPKTWISQFG